MNEDCTIQCSFLHRFETIIQITVACSENMKIKKINKKQMINNIYMDVHLNAKRDKSNQIKSHQNKIEIK